MAYLSTESQRAAEAIDHESMYHRLSAAEAYNKIMEKRVASLELQLEKFLRLKQDIEIESKLVKQQAETQADLKRQTDLFHQRNEAMLDKELKRRIELQQLTERCQSQADRIAYLESIAAKQDAKIQRQKDKISALRHENQQYKEILHPGTAAAAGDQSLNQDGTDDAAPSLVLAAGGAPPSGFRRSETRRAAPPRSFAEQHPHGEVPVPSSFALGNGESSTQDPQRAADAQNDDFVGNEGPDAAAQEDAAPIQQPDPSATVLDKDLLFTVDDSNGDKHRKVSEVLQRWQRMFPRSEDNAPSACCAALVARAAELSESVAQLPRPTAQLQQVRRQMMALVVDSQAAASMNPALKERARSLHSEAQTLRNQLFSALAACSASVPHLVTLLERCATDVVTRTIRANLIADGMIQRCLGRLDRLAHVDWGAGNLPLSSLEEHVESLSHQSLGDAISKLEIPELKKMNAESKEGVSASWLPSTIDAAHQTASMGEEVRRWVPSVTASPQRHHGSEAGHSSAGGGGSSSGGGGASGRCHKGTQVQMGPLRRQVNTAPLTEPEKRVQELTLYRSAWFECLRDVAPVSPRRLAMLSAADDAPIIGDVGKPSNPNSGDAVVSSASHFQPRHRSRSRSRLRAYGNDPRTPAERVRDLLQDYRDRGMPLPRGFMCIKGTTYRFGSRVVSLTDVSGQLAVHTGGGFILFDEYVGRYLPDEERRLDRKAADDIAAKEASLENIRRLPDTPLPAAVAKRVARKARSQSPAAGSPRAARGAASAAVESLQDELMKGLDSANEDWRSMLQRAIEENNSGGSAVATSAIPAEGFDS